MAFVRRYRDLDTDFEKLWKSVVSELENTKEMKVSNELSGVVEETKKPFRSVTATRASVPRAFVGGLREVTVTITGDPDDFVVEAHTGAWFSNLAMPGAAGLIIAGPIGGAVAAGASGIVAVDYERKLSQRIRELVKETSKKELTLEKVEHLP